MLKSPDLAGATCSHEKLRRILPEIPDFARIRAAPRSIAAKPERLRAREEKMKKMLLAAAALAVVASPALAQYRAAVTPGYGQSPSVAWQANPYWGGAPGGVYAQSPGIAGQAYGVYRNGQYIGWDPDPAVRLMLLKDAGSEGN
jgi:hypothetical protein